jgi:hypothetical protein
MYRAVKVRGDLDWILMEVIERMTRIKQDSDEIFVA